jgi:hypothetical protein
MAKKITDRMTPKLTALATTERSFKGLRDTLFDELDQLRSDRIKPERANAVARLATEISRSVSVQCDVLRLVARHGDEVKKELLQ